MWRKHRHTNNTVIHVEVGLKKLIYSTNKHEKKNLPTNEHQSKMTNSLSTVSKKSSNQIDVILDHHHPTVYCSWNTNYHFDACNHNCYFTRFSN